jgi:hypothetical protein
VVIDTNVPVVANGISVGADRRCEHRCVAELRAIVADQCVLLDDRGVIFREYRRYLSPAGQPGVGDRFVKWLWDNQGNPTHCRVIAVTPIGDDDYAEFPRDDDLALFDRSDRVFVAVARASEPPATILNAVDSDWWHAAAALARHAVTVRSLCGPAETMTLGVGASS